MTTVLLTGAAGFLGSHCVEYWLDKTDWNLIAVDSFRHRGRLAWLPRRTDGRLKIINADLSRKSSALAELKPDIIVNAASLSHVDHSIAEPALVWQNNTALILSMLELARECKPRLFIQTSTDEVYGPCEMADRQFAEWYSIVPSNPYAASKAAQEALATSYWRTYGVPVVITNCVNMFGERQHEEKFLPKIIKALRAKQQIEVFADEQGNIGSRWWTHAKNYADLVVFLAGRRQAMYGDGSRRPDRWNLSGQKEIDNLEMVHIAAEIIGVVPQYAIIDGATTRPGHDAHYGLDGSALTKSGWSYPFDLTKSLQETVRWYSSQ